MEDYNEAIRARLRELVSRHVDDQVEVYGPLLFEREARDEAEAIKRIDAFLFDGKASEDLKRSIQTILREDYPVPGTPAPWLNGDLRRQSLKQEADEFVKHWTAKLAEKAPDLKPSEVIKVTPIRKPRRGPPSSDYDRIEEFYEERKAEYAVRLLEEKQIKPIAIDFCVAVFGSTENLRKVTPFLSKKRTSEVIKPRS